MTGTRSRKNMLIVQGGKGPTGPTPTTAETKETSDSSDNIATTAFVHALLNNLVKKVSNKPLTGIADGANKTFTLPEEPIPGTVRIYNRGVRQDPNNDYTLDGQSAEFTEAPYSGDVITGDYDVLNLFTSRLFGITPSGAINGTNKIFELPSVPAAGTVRPFLRGVRQYPVLDFNENGKLIAIEEAPYTGDTLIVDYDINHLLSMIYGETPAGDIDGVNKNFTLEKTPIPGKEFLYLNGLKLSLGIDYGLSNNTIIFTEAPYENDKLLIDYEF